MILTPIWQGTEETITLKDNLINSAVADVLRLDFFNTNNCNRFSLEIERSGTCEELTKLKFFVHCSVPAGVYSASLFNVTLGVILLTLKVKVYANPNLCPC